MTSVNTIQPKRKRQKNNQRKIKDERSHPATHPCCPVHHRLFRRVASCARLHVRCYSCRTPTHDANILPFTLFKKILQRAVQVQKVSKRRHHQNLLRRNLDLKQFSRRCACFFSIAAGSNFQFGIHAKTKIPRPALKLRNDAVVKRTLPKLLACWNVECVAQCESTVNPSRG